MRPSQTSIFSWTWTVLALVGGAGLGCGGGLPEVPPSVDREDAARVLAEETCRSLFDCDCPVNPYRDRGHCLEVLELRGDDADTVAVDGQLEYDGVCVSRLATTRRELGCQAVDEAPCIDCRPFFGSDEEGEPCEKLGVTVDVDTCGRGLRCEGHVCVRLCPSLPILAMGEACTAGIEVLGECEADLHCDPQEHTCVGSPVVGEPCPDRICARDAWCDRADPEAPTCARLREPGQDCALHESCTSGACDGGRCAEPTATVCALPPA